MYKVTSRNANSSTIKVEWNLGKRCNYDCSYCPSVIHDNNSPHTDIEIVKATINKLVSLNKSVRLSFTGGEPCVHPKFDEIVKYAKYKGISWVSVTTNGTRPLEFYKMISPYVNQFVISIHFEYDWMRVVNTIVKLAELTDVGIIGQIMAHHDYMKSVTYVRGLLTQQGIPNTVRRIRWTEGNHDLFDDMRYHPDDLEWINSQEATVSENTVIFEENLNSPTLIHANDVIKLHMNKFNGWTCYAGIESLMINWDGEVYRATCRVGDSLGNIYNGNFAEPVDPIVCSRNFCTCAADIPLTKLAPQ